MATPAVLLPFALTSVTYTMPASASPRLTFVTTPPTFCSWLTGLTVTPAFLKMLVARAPHGTSGAQVTTLSAALARLGDRRDVARITRLDHDFPLIAGEVCGAVAARLSSVTVVMFFGLAEAKTSAGAPWVICVASEELPL